MKITITGSSGLIGQGLTPVLKSKGHSVLGLDLRSEGSDVQGDVLDVECVRSAVAEADGIVHLAAVSRVVWGERDPEKCMLVNVTGVDNILQAARDAKKKPWVIFVSSREVYGEPHSLPVHEDLPPVPINVYGRSKLMGEERTWAAREWGLATAVLRLSNVYGTTDDHVDRVVPAFTRGAAEGRDLRIDGSEHTFDFTHVGDTVRGIASACEAIAGGARALPPVHFLTGRGTTLGQLAQLAIAAAGSSSKAYESASRRYDVARFYGDPGRARELFGWVPTTTIEDGVADLTRKFQALHRAAQNP